MWNTEENVQQLIVYCSVNTRGKKLLQWWNKVFGRPSLQSALSLSTLTRRLPSCTLRCSIQLTHRGFYFLFFFLSSSVPTNCLQFLFLPPSCKYKSRWYLTWCKHFEARAFSGKLYPTATTTRRQKQTNKPTNQPTNSAALIRGQIPRGFSCPLWRFASWLRLPSSRITALFSPLPLPAEGHYYFFLPLKRGQ